MLLRLPSFTINGNSIFFTMLFLNGSLLFVYVVDELTKEIRKIYLYCEQILDPAEITRVTVSLCAKHTETSKLRIHFARSIACLTKSYLEVKGN